MPPIVIVDTSVLLNVLDVPGLNQRRATVLARFGELVNAAANLLLPMGAVFETGNHIAQLPDGRQRRRYAEMYRDRVQEAAVGRHHGLWSPARTPVSWRTCWAAFRNPRCRASAWSISPSSRRGNVPALATPAGASACGRSLTISRAMTSALIADHGRRRSAFS